MRAKTGDEAATGIAIPDAYMDAQRLGSGAEGGTWLATDRGSQRRVVLKRVPAARVPIVRRAFDLLRTVGSPHLPAPRALTVDADEPGARWLATDYVEGAPLSLEATDRVAALREALAVAHALAAIHRTGTHHGDVAPGNVIVTRTGGVMLVDLGQLGQRGTGTPGFIAPEVLAGGGGPAADRFALGSLLCLRLFGTVPWRRPDALVAVRTDADVRQRLQELTADRPTPKGVLTLLELLLHPDPARRIGAADLLVARLGGLVRAAEAGVDLPARATWWLPQRWPYRAGPGGADVEALATRLAARETIRLVAVAGPMGVGRRRVVEELVQQLQSADAGPEAIACEPGALGGVVGRPAATWIEAWLSSAAADKVLGLTSEPPWPSLGSDAGNDAGQRQARAHAAMLVDGVSSATATLVVPVGQRLARALEQHADSQQGAIAVVRVRPWDPKTLGHALDQVLECDDVAAWNRVLLDATGGWPGRVVRAVTACAALDVQSPSPAAVERALETLPGGAVLGLDETTAADVLRAGWCPGDGGLAKLPSHLHDGTAPHASAIAEARRRVGSGLAPLARSVLGKRRRDAKPIGLTLAVDAGAADAIQAALLHDHALPVSRAGSGGALRWLLAGGAGRVCDEAVAVACRGLLADGDARRALELAITHPDGPACRLEAARAAQRLGKPTDALEHLDYAIAIATGTDDGRAAAEGLRWRLLVDRGQAEAAAAEARRRLPELAVDGLGGATARLWGAMAALVSGDGETALGWLDEAEAAMRRVASGHGHAALPGSRTAAAEGVLARVCQLRGNVAQGEGDLAAAQRWYGLAAEAFARACEPVGGLMVRGSLAGLAIPTFDTARGIEDGRRALRGLVARGQLSATLEASLNLVQLLTRSGADEQADAVASLTEALFATRREVDRLVRGRLSRIDAELCVRRRGVRAAEDAFVAAAVDLEAAQGSREAVEAWLCAARCARQEGSWQRAAAHLDRATAIGANDEDSRAMLQLETLALAVSRVPTSASGGIEGAARVALDRGLIAVRGLGDPEALAARGRLDLAWATALGTALALHRRLPVGHPARGKATRRLLDVLERIMNKTEPSDRAAVRASLTADATERTGLRELLSELDGAPVPTAAPQPAPTAPARSTSAEQTGRLSGLIRIYRRLAREDRLEHLLEQVVDAMMELTDAERGAVVVLPLPEAATEQPTENPGEDPHPPRLEVTRELSAAGEGIRFSRSVIERVLSEGEPVLSVDAAHDDRFDGSRSISHLNLRSVLAVPLRFRGEVFGAAYVDHRLRRGAFDEDDLGHMEEFADLAALAVAHARAVAALRSQAEQLEEQRERLAGMLEVREAEVEGLRGRVTDGQDDDRHGMVGSSAGMQKVFRLIDRLADSDVPVVIHGESGTGKELVARAIHRGGPRRDGAFIAENCGAIPETLLESVLFGHARGAFTGAAKAKPGLFEAAHGGTIFLDEVGEMSPGMQTKLLRVLQEGEVRRVGENKSRSVDVRVIAASNADLDAMVEAGTFRRDLYYRINVVKLVLPPLREREGDLPALIEHLASRHGVTDLTVSPSALRVLCRHGWPGNVRELENEVQRWIALAEGTVEVEDLSPALVGGVGDPGPDADDLQIRPRVDLLERDLIKRALDRTGNNQTKAAALLGLSRFGLQKKLRRLAETDAEEAAG